ncbi:MAG: hypothetical protein WCK65_06490 [Rhodospirillaceae bacterium]
MLLATALMGMSLYQTAKLGAVTDAHFVAALSTQGMSEQAIANARGLLLDALGPGGVLGSRSYQCQVFEVDLGNPDRQACRALRINVSGTVGFVVSGTLCPGTDGNWHESSGPGMLTSISLDQRWRDATLKTDTSLYGEPMLSSYRGRFTKPNLSVQVGSHAWRESLAFAYVRLPNGDTHYVLKDAVTLLGQGK